MKKNLIIFVAGIFFAFCIMGIAYVAVTKKFPAVPKAEFLNKAVRKLKDKKFNEMPKATKELLLFDFEDRADIDKWQFMNSTAGLSNEKAVRGNNSLKVAINAGGGACGIKLEDYFEKPSAAKDWSAYEGIAFDIFNPQTSQERIIVQVKDKKEKGVKNDIFLEPGEFTPVEIEVARLRHSVDIYDIGDFTIFMWAPPQERVFYVDNIRLVPYGGRDKKTILSQDLIEQSNVAYARGDYFDFAKKKGKWARANKTGETFIEFPIFLINESGLDCGAAPFSGGVPFPKGELKEASNISISDGQNNNIDFQARPLCRWPDGSIKWLLVDFKKDMAATPLERLSLRYGAGMAPSQKESALKISQDNGLITVATGPLKFTVKKKQFNLFDRVWLEGELMSQDNDLTIQFRGKTYFSSKDSDCVVKVEEEGPVKATIKAEGWFKNEKGEKFCKYVVRMQAFVGTSYVRVYHTFIYTGYPENQYHYLYKGKRLPENETIEDISISMPLSLTGNGLFTFGVDKEVRQGQWLNDISFLQKDLLGEKLHGWIDVGDDGKGAAVIIKNFWQQFPKGFYLDKDNGRLVVSLWPKEAGELDLKTTEDAIGPDAVARGSAFGLAKTHELGFYFHRGDYKAAKVESFAYNFMQPLLVRVDPRWISDTVVLGKVAEYEKRVLPAEATLERLFDWGQRQKEDFKWYGMLDFGDTMSWYRKDSYDESYDEWGWHPRGRWGWFNCEGMGAHTGALLQYLRTGMTKYFKFGEDLSRHMMDVDTCHYNTVANDARLKGKIYDDYSQIGSMHRHSANHWSGRNEEATHTNLTGILLYYYVTGYERAFDVAKETGDFFLKGRVTYFQHPDIAPQRALANLLWGQILLYEATGEARYKDSADKWANILYQGQHNNGSWTDNYNPVEKRWDGGPNTGFMADYTLPALIEYHKITGNKAIKESIIKATKYLMKAEEYKHPFHGLAYSFWLTGDEKFREEGARRLDHLIAHQNQGGDPTMNGMIYQKAYYARMAEFLYSAPFIFEIIRSEGER